MEATPAAQFLLLRRLAWEETPQVELTRSFLEDPQRFLRHLLDR
jgi:hypothetical protein